MTDDSNGNSWKDPAIWGRVVFTLLFLLILGLVVGPLAIILSVVQAVFTIATGEDNRNLRDLGASLTEYIGEILLFTTWNREQKPFPFAEFPRAERTDDAFGEDAAEDATEADADAGAAAGAEAATEAADGAEPAAEMAKAEDAGGDADKEAGSDSAPAEKPGKKSAGKAGKKTSSSKPASDDAAAKD